MSHSVSDVLRSPLLGLQFPDFTTCLEETGHGDVGMKRDMELVRELLLYFEAKTEVPGMHGADVHIDGYTEDQIGLHLNIMAEAGLLVCEPFRSKTNPDRIIRTFVFDLSWKGHEYLDTIRDPKVWKRTKSVLGRVGNWSFGLALDVAKGVALSEARKLGLPV